ncbi:hypothetical protein F5J12DRAFT_887274 [Pisolithus orientalis]|uniref:uncharacterized protein n=1 Tax=Pisolithus orientalis TaxID=936130 RepID=UPI0022248137|nr:uncharacterized protein F5J12DRAFT_887274 [Pisolithus orientalis]KAI6035487.1 hypothetical protein F5J12DRAFT_887274 [Pisolithus orientalis]
MSPSVVSPATPYNDLARSHAQDGDDAPAKISAYYSLVFPNITFYLQTLTVTIGRRCIPPGSSSVNGTDGPTSGHSQVDVDLGPLKSVSRLHARIEYEEEEERFVLVVVGRNGAWVDGVWSGAGSRVPLGERSQIQIASRTFHFVLPPPPAPQDSPSPSSNSSIHRARSPSVDITSISPPSSIPSHSPPPREAPPRPPPKRSPSPEPHLPNSNAISRSTTKSAATSSITTVTAPTSKKRKKLAQSLPKPEVMPPKPPLTYAQLCYRAIRAMGGKATLQDICGWMMENYDWYRYNEGAGWENSVRHNLSSGRAFKKMERSTGEHGKGFFWSVDEQFEHTFEEQEAKAQAQSRAQLQSQAQAANQGQAPPTAGGKDGKKKKVNALEPPLKRSVKNSNGPLPPPLTSTPLPLPSRATTGAVTQPIELGGMTMSEGPKAEPVVSSGIGGPVDKKPSTAAGTATDPVAPAASISGAPSPLSALPASVCLPIVVGTVPSSNPSSSTSSTEEPPPIVLHNNSLVLSPLIFSSLTPDQLKALEEMGAQRALEVLQGHIVRYLKERMGRRKKRKAVGEKNNKKGENKAEGAERSSPFTTTPLPPRGGQGPPKPQPPSTSALSPPVPSSSSSKGLLATQPDFQIAGTKRPASDSSRIKETVPASVDSRPPVPVPIHSAYLATSGKCPERPASPIIIVDDEDAEDGRVAKKRRVDALAMRTVKEGALLANDAMNTGSIVQVVQPGDEDIEIDVC